MTDFSVFDLGSQVPTGSPGEDLANTLERIALAIRELQSAQLKQLPPRYRFEIDDAGQLYLSDLSGKQRAAFTLGPWEPT